MIFVFGDFYAIRGGDTVYKWYDATFNAVAEFKGEVWQLL
jgi:hypothetical protein